MIKASIEQQYLDALRWILTSGESRDDRTGTGTIGAFHRVLQHDMSTGFPLLTTKRVWFKGVIEELLWMISGDTNIRYLQDQGVHIWDEWSDEDGDLGPVYGAQLRYSGYEDEPYAYDQLQKIISGLRDKPYSRRHVISLWSPKHLDSMALPPCHGVAIQFYVRDQGRCNTGSGCSGQMFTGHRKLDMLMYQRSADMFLGVPFNIASYAAMLMLVASQVNMQPGVLTLCLGDYHIYNNHIEQVQEQLTREPKALPEVHLMMKPSIDDYTYNDFQLVGYDPHPTIKAEVSV